MHLAFCLTWSLVAVAGIDGDQDDNAEFKLTVALAKQENILYEPVVFRIALEYVGKKPLIVVPAWDRQWGGLQVLFAARPDSEDEQPPPPPEYRGYPYSLSVPVGHPRGPIKLYPGEPLTHVEASLWYLDYFAERPGLLWIKARYRYTENPDKFVESAPLAVRLHEVPKSERQAARLWATPQVASVVQYGAITGNPKYHTTRESVEAANKAKQELDRIVTKYPKSVYAFYAELALRKPAKWAEVAFDGLQMLEPGESPDLALVERTEQHLARSSMLFPDDERLDVEVTYEFPEYTGFKEVLEVISAQSGVPLRLAPELESKKLLSVRQEVPLREFMKGLEGVPGYGQVWSKDGDGYLLISEEQAAKLNKRGGRQGRDAQRRNVPRVQPRRKRAPASELLARPDEPLPLTLVGLLAAGAIMLVYYVRYHVH